MRTKSDDLILLLRQMLVPEGCVTIAPYPEPFRRWEHDFIQGLRRIPAAITAPPGGNPYDFTRRGGRWVMVWIPDIV